MSAETLQVQLDEMTAELIDRYEELTILYQLGAELASLFDVDDVCSIGLEKAVVATGATRAILAIAEDAGLRVVASHGAQGLTSGGITDYVATHGQELLLHEDEAAPDGTSRAGTDNGPVLSVPLLPPGGGLPLGALTLAAKADKARFTSGDAKLAGAVANQVAAAVYRSRLAATLRTAVAVRREVEIAAGIQRSLLPGAPPDLPGVVLAALCEPAANVGGDYYDYLVDGSGRLSLVIADVAGHSIGSALMMAMARSILRREIAEGKHPSDVLAAANDTLFDDLVRAELFFTVFCARLDPATGALEYANGGHNPPFVRRAGGLREELDGDGAAVGIMRDVVFERGATTLAAGDTLLLYTDGAPEAVSPEGKQFGERRLQAEIGSEAPGQLVDSIFASVRAHAGGARQSDDITLVAVQMVGSV
ncbi:MAG TPA: PP2C family protein-serine/threonine phosphatase [Gaiellaceae bacterium]|nr:PP2C family protein-serine/threonine phosphatase [Gaiellaceae bacterium]